MSKLRLVRDDFPDVAYPPCCDDPLPIYEVGVKVAECSRCWADRKADEEAEDRAFHLERWAKAKEAKRVQEEQRIAAIEAGRKVVPLDCHSEEFAARVKAIFGRQLKYGDGPL